MANISNVIEDFLMSMLCAEETYSFTRGELAERFECVPSQINYVLGTRFTPDRGYVVTSRRGGGGCVKVVRLSTDATEVLRYLSRQDSLGIKQAEALISLLEDRRFLSEDAARVAEAAVRSVDDDQLRHCLMTNMVQTIFTQKE